MDHHPRHHTNVAEMFSCYTIFDETLLLTLVSFEIHLCFRMRVMAPTLK
jgi:hypothetical protein